MEKVNLRRVNEWDAPAMLKIYSPYADKGLCTIEPASPALSEYIQRIDKYTYGRGWVMCEINNDPAGICLIRETADEPDNGFISDIEIYVKPEYKRRHVGTALYEFMRDIMQHGNRREIYVNLFIDNTEGITFFTSLGFKQICSDKRLIRMGKKLEPVNPEAEMPTKPYLIDNFDYERVRELAEKTVKQLDI